MDGSGKKIEIIPDYFQASTPVADSHRQGEAVTCGEDLNQQQGDSSTPRSGIDSHQRASTSQPSSNSLPSPGNSFLWTGRKSRRSSFMLRLLSLRGLPFHGTDGEDRVEISSVELESLRSELAQWEDKETHLKAQFEHLDKILRFARLSGYLYMRTRWAALPGEPPPIDDCEVDDWLPRFVVLQGPCLFFYLSSTDLSPQDSTFLSDIAEVGRLPDVERADDERWCCFYIITRYGLRFECASSSKIQVDSWLTVLREDAKLGPDQIPPVGHYTQIGDPQTIHRLGPLR